MGNTHKGFYSTILSRRRLAAVLGAVALAHVLLYIAALALIIIYVQLWAIAAVLWIPLMTLPLRWTTGMLRKIFAARDDDILAVNGVRTTPRTGDASGEMLANVVEEIAIATGGAEPETATCPSDGMNAFISDQKEAGHERPLAVFTSAMVSGLTRNELAAVAANLYAHRRNFDRMLATMAAAMYMAVFLAADVFFILTVLAWNLGASSDFVTGPVVVMLVVGMVVAPIAASGLAMMAAMRRQRLLDDLDAVRITNDPDGLAGALEKISSASARLQAEYSAANVHFYFDAVADPARRFPWQKLAAHPTPQARIAALSAAARLRQSGGISPE